MTRVFTTICRRDLRRLGHAGSGALNATLMFVLLTALFPLALGPAPGLLREGAAGFLVLVCAFTTLMNLERLYDEDLRDGTLDMILLSDKPLGVYAAGRMFSHWLGHSLPLVLLAPLAAASLGIAPAHFGITMLIIALASAYMVISGGVISALQMGSEGTGVMLAFLAWPLYIPALIFAASALDMAYRGLSPQTPAALLAAMLAAALPLGPLCADRILRWQNE